MQLAHDYQSERKTPQASVSEDTKLGPWIFKMIIEDLQVALASGV